MMQTLPAGRAARAAFRITSRHAPSILGAAFTLLWFSDTIADPDLWGHVRFGQDFLRSGLLTQADPYSYVTAGSRWINHEWLSEAVFAAVFTWAGARGLVLLKLCFAGGIVWSCFGTLRRGGLDALAATGLLILAVIPFRMGMGTIRPQLFTYLGFAALLGGLARTPVGGERRLWWLPLLFGVWVNLHGGVLAGVGVLGIWLGVRFIRRCVEGERPWRQRVRDAAPLALLGLLSLLALGLNPYGPDLPLFLIRTATVPRPEIVEWRPIDLGSFPGILVFSLMAITVLGLVGTGRPRSLESVAIVIVAAFFTLLSRRHSPLFTLSAMLLAGEHVGDALSRWTSAVRHLRPGNRVVGLAALLAALLLIVLTPSHWRCIRIDAAHFAFPARAVALLRASGVQGNLALPFDWGEYALWHLGPAVKVSIDGRRETIYSDESYRRATDFERGSDSWNVLLRTTRTDLALLRIQSPTVARLAGASDWIPLYADSFCVLFARAGWPGLDRVLRTPVPALPDNGDGLCFP